MNGCDSIVTLDLTVHPVYSIGLTEEICDGDTYEVGDSVYTTTGLWLTNLTTITGCDSIVSVDLRVHPVYDIALTEEICEGASYEVGNSVYTTTGIHVTNLQSINGCDSIVTLDLTVNPVFAPSISAEICDGETYEVGTTGYTVAGTWVTNLTTINGCDSIVTLDLTVHPVYNQQVFAEICDGDTYSIGDSIYTTMGSHQTLMATIHAVSYTHLRAHETLRYLVCRLLLEKKK